MHGLKDEAEAALGYHEFDLVEKGKPAVSLSIAYISGETEFKTDLDIC